MSKACFDPGLRVLETQTRWLIAIAMAVVIGNLQSVDAQEFREGVHYLQIPVTLERPTTERIEVVELFSYGCIHCYDFEKPLKRWLNRTEDRVSFRRVHVVFQRSWIPLAQAFYTAIELEVLDKVHNRLFAAIHDHNLKMYQRDLLRRLFEQGAGVESQKFQETFDSDEVRRQVFDSDRMLQLWRVDSTPTLVVDGRYRIVANQAVPSAEMMLIVAEYLVDKILSERTQSESQG